MRYLLISFGLSICLWAIRPEAAVLFDRQVDDGCRAPITAEQTPVAPDAGIIGEMLDWIEAETDYDVSAVRNSPPGISFCRTGDVIAYETGTALVDAALNGAYDHIRHQILLVQPWNAANAQDNSIFLHEIIHAVQLSNRTYSCLQEPEWEAYQLQERYLAQHGIDAGFDWLQIFFWSQCPRDIHPD